jgi:2-hydroxychromene-2-carboxylate isomerase
LRELLEGVGFDPASIDGDEIKNQLRADTDEAVSSAAFGAPTLWLNCEISWGNDRLRFCRGCAESIFVKFDSLAFVR